MSSPPPVASGLLCGVLVALACCGVVPTADAETEYLLAFCTDEERHNDPPKCALRDRVAPPASMLGKEGNHYRNALERCTTSPCPDADAAMRRVIAVEKELRDAVDSIRAQLGDDDAWYQRVADEARQAIRDARAELPSAKRTDVQAYFITQLDGITFIGLRELKKAEDAERQCSPASTCSEAAALLDHLPKLDSQLDTIFKQLASSYGASDANVPPLVLRSTLDAFYGQRDFERRTKRLRERLAGRQPLSPLPPNARLVRAAVNTPNIREHHFPQDIARLNDSIRDLKVYKTADQLIIEFNTNPLPKVQQLPTHLLVRLFDRNGEFLTYFQTKEAYTQFQQFADEGNHRRTDGMGASSQFDRDLPPWSVLKPRGNRLAYTVNRRDLDYTDVVEVGFVIPLLIR